MRKVLAVLSMLFITSTVQAEVKTKVVPYEFEGVTMKGYLAWDDSIKGKMPGIFVVHEWWGLNDYARDRAQQLAKLGYVAFCPDMYGDGKVTEHPKEAAAMAGAVRKNQAVWVGRAQAGLKVLRENDHVDSNQLAAIGYCFGGSTALQLAYSGANLKAVVTFHAAIPVPEAEQAKAIKSKIQINHGALDKFIPEETLQNARNAFDTAKVDYQMIYHGGAVHSFTVADIGKAGVPGLAYQAEADHRSWHSMRGLFHEVFASHKK